MDKKCKKVERLITIDLPWDCGAPQLAAFPEKLVDVEGLKTGEVGIVAEVFADRGQIKLSTARALAYVKAETKEPIWKTLAKAGIPLRDDEEWWDGRKAQEGSLAKQCEAASGRALAGAAGDFLSCGGGSVTSKSVNAVLISLGRAIGQVVSDLESPADAAVAAIDGLLEGIVAGLGPANGETLLALLGPAKKRAGRR